MPRIRALKPEFWSSPGNDGLEPWSRLLFAAMWNWADDTGRGTAEPRELMGFAFPREDWMTIEDFRRFLGEVRRGFDVGFYRVDGRSYYYIPSWDDHQKIDKRSNPKHPAPEQGEEYDPDPPDQRKEPVSENTAEGSANPIEGSAFHIGPSTLEIGTGEQGNRGSSAPNGAGAFAPGGITPGAISARTVVAAWVDASRANGVEPSKAQIGQVGKAAKELLIKNDPARVLAAAKSAGAKGFASIDRELTVQAGRRQSEDPPWLHRDPVTGRAFER